MSLILKIALSIFGVLSSVFLSLLKIKRDQINELNQEAETKRVLAVKKMEKSKNDLSSKIHKIDTSISFSDASRLLSHVKTQTPKISKPRLSKLGKSRGARLSKDRRK